MLGKKLAALGAARAAGDLLIEKTAAVREGRASASAARRWSAARQAPLQLAVEVMPLRDGAQDDARGLLYVVDDVTALPRPGGGAAQGQRGAAVRPEELQTTNEELQSSNEEMETTNEELQSANEELQTTNEELQSTNEELETTNEELQSTNAELDATNRELAQRTEEMNALGFCAAHHQPQPRGRRGGAGRRRPRPGVEPRRRAALRHPRGRGAGADPLDAAHSCAAPADALEDAQGAGAGRAAPR